MPADQLALDAEARRRMVEAKITCPFLGSAVDQELLSVRGAANNPLAAVEDLRRLGNAGGGDLGDLLAFFARGNHAFMRSDKGVALDEAAPAGLFSLELPGSQGSHPGHSGILQGDPGKLESGRFSRDDFARLAGLARGGHLRRSDVGRFIADNLTRDPHSKVTGHGVAELLAHDLGAFVEALGPTLIARLAHSASEADKAHRVLEEKLTRLLGEDNLVGSAGEFGLLFAFLARSPDTRTIDGEPALSVANVETMFVRKRLPDGWETWRKTRADWVVHTTFLAMSAYKEYRRLKAGEGA